MWLGWLSTQPLLQALRWVCAVLCPAGLRGKVRRARLSTHAVGVPNLMGPALAAFAFLARQLPSLPFKLTVAWGK